VSELLKFKLDCPNEHCLEAGAVDAELKPDSEGGGWKLMLCTACDTYDWLDDEVATMDAQAEEIRWRAEHPRDALFTAEDIALIAEKAKRQREEDAARFQWLIDYAPYLTRQALNAVIADYITLGRMGEGDETHSGENIRAAFDRVMKLGGK
jgi:hypothetical protein